MSEVVRQAHPSQAVYATLITLGILTMMLCGVLIYGVGR